MTDVAHLISPAGLDVTKIAHAGFLTTTPRLAAQNFTMPALSPTMTEGNIAAWKVKEGDSFSAGDVLLEIETDKATMDVEAPDDGQLVKIVKPEGSKSVSVGTRIAVLAEPGDDLASLEMPPDEGPTGSVSVDAASTKDNAKKDAPQPSRQDGGKDETPAQKKAESLASSGKSSVGGPPNPKYPLLPSVQYLLHSNGIDESAVPQMVATGPQGRLLKGDVLAYLGSIGKEQPLKVAETLQRLSHLDLNNIKAVPPKAPPKASQEPPPAAAAKEEKPPPKLAHVTLPISLGPALDVQKRLAASLGVHMPLATLVARAADVANDALPPPRGWIPTADELFDELVGPASGRRTVRVTKGDYVPDILAVSDSAAASPARRTRKKDDVYDILAGTKPRRRAVTESAAAPPAEPPTGTNLFSLTVPEAEETRAKVFLERVKVVLENEPGRLVL